MARAIKSEIRKDCIDGVDYPLEHDKAASHIGTRAAKERQRRVLLKVIWSQAGGCLLLTVVWFLLEWRISKLRKAEALDVDEVIAAQKSRLQRAERRRIGPPPSHAEDDGWGAVQLGWAGQSLEPWEPAKDLLEEEEDD
ncbi:unnamed protein product [Symbiodinium natans]|uniref:Uncharacterized protein n=1 Tax=Symbiodinium natans TaxID=878477 RepID=A0A812LNG8_9DINO|nr:unnamed protein product [Symbiodinium natans]